MFMLFMVLPPAPVLLMRLFMLLVLPMPKEFIVPIPVLPVSGAVLLPKEGCRCCWGTPGGGARLNPERPPPGVTGDIVGGGGREKDDAVREGT